jgi:hypothetical protein
MTLKNFTVFSTLASLMIWERNGTVQGHEWIVVKTCATPLDGPTSGGTIDCEGGPAPLSLGHYIVV